MTKSMLIGTVFAAALIASPGLALAQTNGGGASGAGTGNYAAIPGGNGMNNNGGGNGGFGGTYGAGNENGGYNGGGQASNAGYGETGNIAGYGRNGNNNGVYGQVGAGGYYGQGAPVRTNDGNNGGNANNGGGNGAGMLPAQRNPLLADNGDVRAKKMIGTSVFNDANHQIGTVQDLLIGQNGVWAVVRSNNNGRRVAVPFRDFVFGDAAINSHDKLVLPRTTEADLARLPRFRPNEANYGNNNGGNNGGGFAYNTNGGAFGNNNGNGYGFAGPGFGGNGGGNGNGGGYNNGAGGR